MSKRLERAKARVNKLVDAGVKFNPAGVGAHTRKRALDNFKTHPATLSDTLRGKVLQRAHDAAVVYTKKPGSISSPRYR